MSAMMFLPRGSIFDHLIFAKRSDVTIVLFPPKLPPEFNIIYYNTAVYNTKVSLNLGCPDTPKCIEHYTLRYEYSGWWYWPSR